MDLQKYCENRAMNGYGSALLYRDAGEQKYHILIPLETTPFVAGSVDTFDFDILTCPSKGQVAGKETLDQKDVDFLWHRDNVRRLEALSNKVLDFLVVYQDFTARTFTGTIKVRPQDATADIMRGTFTITPMSAGTTTIDDARPLIQETVTFSGKVPSAVSISSEKAYTLKLTANVSGATFTAKSSNASFTATVEGDTLTVTYTGEGTAVEYGIVEITASKENYATWTTTIAVENVVA